MQGINEFGKKRDFLVCVDSDGCAMDTMNIKHTAAFAPCLIDVWGLFSVEKEVRERWYEINLHSMTRGINRFKGLALILSEVNEKHQTIDGIEELSAWVRCSSELSERSLRREIETNGGSNALRRALLWSEETNRAISRLGDDSLRPFRGVKEALAVAHAVADVATVSSANRDAVLTEWKRHGLLAHTDVVMTQESGSKADCIRSLLEKGYSKRHTVMCGDAPGDLSAAENCGVYFYPILARHEEESWNEFKAAALKKLTNEIFGGEYQQTLIKRFKKNLENQSCEGIW